MSLISFLVSISFRKFVSLNHVLFFYPLHSRKILSHEIQVEFSRNVYQSIIFSCSIAGIFRYLNWLDSTINLYSIDQTFPFFKEWIIPLLVNLSSRDDHLSIMQLFDISILVSCVIGHLLSFESRPIEGNLTPWEVITISWYPCYTIMGQYAFAQFFNFAPPH